MKSHLLNQPRYLLIFLLPLAALAITIAIFPIPETLKAKKREESKYYPLKIFSRVLAHIETSYVDRVDVTKLIYGAIKGMVNSLDPHSSYLTPEEYKTIKEEVEGKFGGIGIEVDYRYGRLIVISPLPDTPAEKAGIKSGDEIISIDSTPVYMLTLQDAIRKMRGKPGSTIKLKIKRGENKIIEMEIERREIRIKSVESEFLSRPRKIGLIRIKVFQEGTYNQFKKYLDSLYKNFGGKLNGLIIDLRNNPGGLLDQAIYIADEFLARGTILTTRKNNGEIINTEKAHRIGTRTEVELIIIVNEYTASAAEVLTAALQDNSRAIVAGMKTFGKGSAQNIIRLPDKSALKLTTALYVTPAGKIIQAEGIQPDIVIPPVKLDIRKEHEAFRESNIEGHLKAQKASTESIPEEEERKTTNKIKHDYQLFMAYQYLKAKIKEKAIKDK